jgi:vacuolar-type H+-ATPase subunit B/Vma2
MKMENIESCTRDMYQSSGRGFTDKQKNDYMKACIRSYEQAEMKERLKKRSKKD